MQTTNRHAPDFCDCVPAGETSPHSTTADCAANQASTISYLTSITASAISQSLARGVRLRAAHHTHLTPVYGCPACPLDGRFRRDSAESEWYVPERAGV